jgi:hypothetical protein
MEGIKHPEHANWIIYSELGIILNCNTKIPIGTLSKSTGYIYINHIAIHRVIYEAFHNIKLRTEQHINHINRIKTDNRIENLEMVTNQQNTQWTVNRTGEYKGVSWNKEKNKWKAELKYNNKNAFLGYFETEIEGAKAYNDYAQYMNENNECKYMLNDIKNYVTISRNIPQDTKETQLENITSKYRGVSFDSTRKYYKVSIKLQGKTYNLGNNANEIECAKVYNQQALYFNNHENGKFILNEIVNYVTIEKNIYKEIQDNKKSNKSSKYLGVTKYKDTVKFRCLLVHDKKQISLGIFVSELEAALAYNKKASELNDECGKMKYQLNIF